MPPATQQDPIGGPPLPGQVAVGAFDDGPRADGQSGRAVAESSPSALTVRRSQRPFGWAEMLYGWARHQPCGQEPDVQVLPGADREALERRGR